ncbi:MAG TPA: RICIN domain-containing protein [Streptosporangiaceae bacterium]|jgi:hypothetical protein|nr:RICIN domain-containing protein [Streptosporangiaceae bacterium]
MRRLLYAVAAVVALAPLAAIAPASAAVAHPAAAAATCTGGWPEVNVHNYSNVNDQLVGYWSDVSGVIDESSSGDVFCEVALTAPYYAFRLKGTSNCVVYTPSTGIVSVKGCDYSSTNQQWEGIGANFLTTHSARDKCLDGRAGQAVFMNGCTAAPDNQDWVEG